MKLGELLREIKKTLYDWGFFMILAIMLTNLIFSGIVYQKPNVEAELSNIIKYFNDAAVQYGVTPNYKNLVVGFVDTFPVNNWIGLCQRGTGPGKFVAIKKAYFQHTSIEQQYALVIHELGHCVMNRDHVEGYRDNGCPKSIMHPSDGLFGCFFRDQDYYFKELFGIK
jgi:hypothetical protein